MASLKECPAVQAEANAHYPDAVKYCTQKRIAVDGGAHRGSWTDLMLKDFETVAAFEPLDELRNRIDRKAVTYPFALGYDSGIFGMAFGPDNDGQGHIINDRDAEVCTVVCKLDDVDLHNIDFIKLDVEGMELQALKGAEAKIIAYQPVILLEMNGLSERYGDTDFDTDAWLIARGYQHKGNRNKNHLYVHRDNFLDG